MGSALRLAEGFIVVRRDGRDVRVNGTDVLVCCSCRREDGGGGVVEVLGDAAWVVADLIRAMNTHKWAHDVSAKRGIPMSEFETPCGPGIEVFNA